MIVRNPIDEDTIVLTLDTLDNADYVLVEATTGETVRLAEEGDRARFEDLDGGYLTLTPVIEQDGTAYRYESSTVPHQGTPFPTPTPTATPPETVTVEFTQSTDDDGTITVEVTLLGLGDASYVYAARDTEGSTAKSLRATGDRVWFRGLEPGDKLLAVARVDGESELLERYTVQ
jgi:hypothetical protein